MPIEEPPLGWRHPHYWEPQGGFVRIDRLQATLPPSHRSAPSSSNSLEFFSCGTPRRLQPDADADDDDDWTLWSSVEKLLCAPRPAPKAVSGDAEQEEDPEPPLPDGTQERFMRTADSIKQWRPSKSQPSDDEKLRLYALFKQGTEGRAKGAPPSGFDLVATAKYNAWKQCGPMARGRAQLDYIAEAEAQMARYR